MTRSKILNDLKDWLSGISIANGYRTDVQTVKRGIHWEQDMSERPAIAFWNDKNRRKALFDDCEERELHIFLWAYVNITVPGDYDGLDNLEYDVGKSIRNNRNNWDQAVEGIDIGDSTIYEAGHESSIGVFEMEIEITFRETF